jgi:hypothetical protein
MKARRVRTLTVLALAALVAAATFALAFSALAVGFGLQSRDQLTAIRIVRTVLRHPLTASAFWIDGGPAVRARCWSGSVATFAHGNQDAAVVHLSSGRDFVAVAGRVRRLAGPPLGKRQLRATIALAGCSRVIAETLAAAISQERSLLPVETTLHDRYVLRYDIARPGSREQIFVDPISSLPVALTFTEQGITGSSSIRYLRPIPALGGADSQSRMWHEHASRPSPQ